jgi:RHS repeat-associated protein
MPGRSGGAGYRYGFNGKENDRETGWQDYGMRMYSPKLSRFFTVDPISSQYPELTPYQFASNSPVSGVDQDGLEYFFAADGSFLGHLPNANDPIEDRKVLVVKNADYSLNATNLAQLNAMRLDPKFSNEIVPVPVYNGYDGVSEMNVDQLMDNAHKMFGEQNNGKQMDDFAHVLYNREIKLAKHLGRVYSTAVKGSDGKSKAFYPSNQVFIDGFEEAGTISFYSLALTTGFQLDKMRKHAKVLHDGEPEKSDKEENMGYAYFWKYKRLGLEGLIEGMANDKEVAGFAGWRVDVQVIFRAIFKARQGGTDPQPNNDSWIGRNGKTVFSNQMLPQVQSEEKPKDK